MTTPVSLRPTGPTFTSTAEDIANNSVVSGVGDTITTIADYADKFDAAGMAFAKLAQSRAGVRIAGAFAGAVTEKLVPGTFEAAGRTLVNVGERFGLSPGVMRGASNTLGAMVHGAGIAAIGYDAFRSFTDTKADLDSRLLQGGAALAVGAATFIPGIGTAIVVADVLTGGGVTGGVKGLVALGDAFFTGDTDALNSWVDSAKNGDQGWLLKWAANNETIGAVASAVTDTVVAAGSAMREGVKDAVQGVGHAISRGWHALFG